MNLPVDVLIVGASPIYCRAVQQLLEAPSGVYRSRILTAPQLADPREVTSPDALLIAPQTWEQMACWLPRLRRFLSLSPWVLLAELRLIGMFMSALHNQPCAFVPLDSEPEELRAILKSLADGRAFHLAAELQARFARGAHQTARFYLRFPSTMELQCGCAVSLGLSNRQIAETLHLGEATVKTHIHHLLQKLGLANRTELGTFVQRALVPLSPPL